VGKIKMHDDRSTTIELLHNFLCAAVVLVVIMLAAAIYMGAVMNKALALSEHQMTTAAALFAPSARSDFLRSVVGRLVDNQHPSDHDVAVAPSLVLNCRGVSTALFMNDAAPNRQWKPQRE
jgi:hypothetical protein